MAAGSEATLTGQYETDVTLRDEAHEKLLDPRCLPPNGEWTVVPKSGSQQTFTVYLRSSPKPKFTRQRWTEPAQPGDDGTWTDLAASLTNQHAAICLRPRPAAE